MEMLFTLGIDGRDNCEDAYEPWLSKGGWLSKGTQSYTRLYWTDSPKTSKQFKGMHTAPVIQRPSMSVLCTRCPTGFYYLPEAHFKQLVKNEGKGEPSKFVSSKGNASYNGLEVNLEKQLQVWKESPSWVDQPPEVKVTVPRGSLCNLNVKFEVGLPPDAVYNIVIDPDNRRVFKNIKEVISRKVLLDEGQRQVVELEQAAIWRFLWWSGTISVHVFVDQNRQDHTVKFKQGKEGFMKRFEGCWKVEPLFLDDHLCSPLKPETVADYHSCTGGKGRVGSVVSLQQLIQPALVPPPPISWYLRGITTRTTEMLINDLRAEVARIRGSINGACSNQAPHRQNDAIDGSPLDNVNDIKERWHCRRRNNRRHNKRSLVN